MISGSGCSLAERRARCNTHWDSAGQLLAEGDDFAVPRSGFETILFVDGSKGVDLLWEFAKI